VSSRPLLVFRFDGVLVEWLAEYWWSSRRPLLGLDPSLVLPEQATILVLARRAPRIHKGWEMVLVGRSKLVSPRWALIAALRLKAGLRRRIHCRGRGPIRLAAFLLQGGGPGGGAAVGRRQRDGEGAGWLCLGAYPGVPEGCWALSGEGADWGRFDHQGWRPLPRGACLPPCSLSPGGSTAREGSKGGGACSQLRWRWARPLWFIEDRAATPRDDPLRRPGHGALVSGRWGYLGRTAMPRLRGDRPAGADAFAGPLAIWP